MFTIGEFSKRGSVSARMLRHYDRIGLLQPAHTGYENGYRYYDEAQLPILAKIETLKDYGFTLAEIRLLLPLSEIELAERIHRRRVEAYKELNEMRKTLRRMEDHIVKMEGTSMTLENYRVILMDTPEQKVYGIRRRINIGQTHELFQELKREMEEKEIRRTGVMQLLYHGKNFSYDDMDAEAQAHVDSDHPDVKVIPAVTCAAVTHIGPYETLKYAYDALGLWMKEHPEYEICAPAIERYIRDEEMAKSPEELETGILFPVRKVR